MSENENSITVRVTVKKQIGNYEPAEVMGSVTYAMPDDASVEQLMTMHAVLYDQLASQVEAEIDDLVARLTNPTYPIPEEYAAPPEPMTDHATSQIGAPVDMINIELKRFLSAKNRQPGMVYAVEVDEYEVTDEGRITFYGPYSKYGKFGTYTDRDAFQQAFKGWTPGECERKPLPGGNAYLTIQVLDKKAGEYYDQDVVAVTREWVG